MPRTRLDFKKTGRLHLIDRSFDRIRDWYHERIVDAETGDVVHECDEAAQRTPRARLTASGSTTHVTTPEVLAVVGAAASAISAAAAWAAVRQSRQLTRAQRRPRLIAVHLEAQDTTVQFMIANAGQGVALAACCTFVASGRVFGGLIGEGVIRGGERWRLRTSVPSTRKDAAGALCSPACCTYSRSPCPARSAGAASLTA